MYNKSVVDEASAIKQALDAIPRGPKQNTAWVAEIEKAVLARTLPAVTRLLQYLPSLSTPDLTEVERVDQGLDNAKRRAGERFFPLYFTQAFDQAQRILDDRRTECMASASEEEKRAAAATRFLGLKLHREDSLSL